MYYYTIRQMAEMFNVTEHTLRFYTDKGLLPCERDGGNRRVFNEESVNWMQGIMCLKGCGASIEDIGEYCRLCLLEESEENLRARYAIILKQRDEAYARLAEAKATVKYQVDVDTIKRANAVTPLSAVQNIYSMLERGVEERVIPYCLAHDIGVVPFSPIASGFLSGRVTKDSDFSHSDDVRKFVPQLSEENIAANQPILDLLKKYAQRKNATKAQISLSWMLHKYPNIVPIPGSKNQERIIENLGAWNVSLTDDEFCALEKALDAIPVHGHRGFVEQQGGGMANWSRK